MSEEPQTQVLSSLFKVNSISVFLVSIISLIILFSSLHTISSVVLKVIWNCLLDSLWIVLDGKFLLSFSVKERLFSSKTSPQCCWMPSLVVMHMIIRWQTNLWWDKPKHRWLPWLHYLKCLELLTFTLRKNDFPHKCSLGRSMYLFVLKWAIFHSIPLSKPDSILYLWYNVLHAAS